MRRFATVLAVGFLLAVGTGRCHVDVPPQTRTTFEDGSWIDHETGRTGCDVGAPCQDSGR